MGTNTQRRSSTPGQWYRERNPIHHPAEPRGPRPKKVELELLYSARFAQIKEWERRGFVVDGADHCGLSYAYYLKGDESVIIHLDNLCDDTHWMDFAMILMALAG